MGKKKDKLPKGAGRVPEWWMEITPHDTLYLEEEESKRQADYEEALKFAQLAAEQDLLQKWGGEGFPNWNPATDGPRTADEEKVWSSKGYKRNDKQEWVDEEGKPLEGRQFKGEMPPGYLPGQYIKVGPGTGIPGPGNLHATKYQRDEGKSWEQPAWMQLKLRSTKDGGAIRKGNYDNENKTITKGTGKRVRKVPKPTTDGEAGEDEYIEEVIDDDEEYEEEIIEGEGDEAAEKGIDASIHEATELEKILKKRLAASG